MLQNQETGKTNSKVRKTLVQLQAQIHAQSKEPFVRNNVDATKLVLAAAKKNKVKYIVHVSSSVVISRADDDYTDTKREQENLVKECGISYVSLRPPLMFGWFDKKHLGWLTRFMAKTPIFPIPGHGRYMRQPLFVRDFCKVIAACVRKRPKNKTFTIIGKENIDYIDLIRELKKVKGLKTIIVKVPIPIFKLFLRVYGLFLHPPFTPDQLDALTAGDSFPVENWDEELGVKFTPIREAIRITHKGRYSHIVTKP